jgi:hypothetical protein
MALKFTPGFVYFRYSRTDNNRDLEGSSKC